jgi:aryl-alcohol dehydrogenase-like predicted oxidoreductase
MEYRELGHRSDGVCYRLWDGAARDMYGTSNDDAASQSAYRALDAGINFFDSSPSYGTGLAEERLGKVLRGRRDEIIVGTKAGKYGPDELDFSVDRIRRGFEDGLRRLGTDYVDILQLHNVVRRPGRSTRGGVRGAGPTARGGDVSPHRHDRIPDCNDPEGDK